MTSRAESPVVLVPPSEGKAEGGHGPAWAEATMRFDLDASRRRVMTAARTRLPPDLATAPTLPAIDRYTGVLYGALGYHDLDRAVRRRIDAQVVTFSGLWGLVAPRDPIPEYRLKMSAAAPRLGRLATWWRPRIAPVLDAFVDGRVVWDLLPQEHHAAWPTSDAPARRITVRFLDDIERRGTRKLITVSHWNKLLKGALVRHVVEHRLVDPDGLAGFRHPQGYRYRPELTEEEGGRLVVSMVADRVSRGAG
jgi:cytoplasmic iron level regulating protein YaaA (DUF328/UPF0246 family)